MTKPVPPLVALPLLLLACAPETDGASAGTGAPADAELLLARQTVEQEGPEDCLLMVWSNQEERRTDFDRAHDFVDGGAISCATGTSASQFEAAIVALRDAAKSGNKARLLAEVGLPLLYIDSAGERREIEDRDEVEAVFDEVFDPAMLDLLERLDLAQMTVSKDHGGYFGLGAVWLVVDRDGGRPRLVTVNRQALDEAAEAARREAERRQGEVVPLAD